MKLKITLLVIIVALFHSFAQGNYTDLSGVWDWTCCNGVYKSQLTLTVDAQGKISGHFHTHGSINGKMEGTTLKFKRNVGTSYQYFTLTPNAEMNSLSGFFTGFSDGKNGKEFSATKQNSGSTTSILDKCESSETNAINAYAKVTRVQGTVIAINSDGSKCSVGKNTNLKKGTIIKSDQKSRASFQYKNPETGQFDGPIVNISRDTEMEVIDQSFQSSNQPIPMKIFRGVVRYFSGSWKKGSGYMVRTGTSICGIRGTDFILDTKEDGTDIYTLIEGEIVLSFHNRDTKVFCVPGDQVILRKDGEINVKHLNDINSYIAKIEMD